MPHVIPITDFAAPELDVYARLTENQLLNRADPANALFVTESPLVIGRALDAGCVPVSFLMETAVLENVMNPTNIGAIFRSAAALGMDAVLLTAAGSDPLYRRASRVSMGNVFLVPWAYLPEDTDWTETLHAYGFKTAAMALREDSIRLNDPRLAAEPKLAVVMGTEGDGLAADTIARCDYTVMIPMSHGVDSLNVAAASAVAFYQLGLMSQGGANGGS